MEGLSSFFYFNRNLNKLLHNLIFLWISEKLFFSNTEIKSKQNLLNELIAIYNRLKIASHNHECDNYNLSDNIKNMLFDILQESIRQNDSLSIYN